MSDMLELEGVSVAIGALRATGVSVLLSESDYVHSEALTERLYVIERGLVTGQAQTSEEVR